MTESALSPQSEDELIERLQNWLRGVEVVVLGSGASADYGYPLMGALASSLLETIAPEPVDQEQWETIAKRLRSGTDLEAALTETQASPGLVAQIIGKTWEIVSARDLDFRVRLLEGHKDFPLADLVHWLDTGRKRIDIITTNYDRVVEYACDTAGVMWLDGTGFGYLRRQIRGFKGIYRENSQVAHATIARIWKVHGSLDWFSDSERGRFVATSLMPTVPIGYLPLIVTPGQAKYERALEDPFRSILAGSDEVVHQSRTFLCIGYGFNDKHVHEKLISKTQDGHSRFVVVARSLTPNAKKFLIENHCRNYIAIERGYDDAHSLIWHSGMLDPATIKCQAWRLQGLCSILM